MTGEPEVNHNAIVNLLAQKFIARSDIKAVQHADGSYAPRHSKFTRADILDHIRGEVTYGHYLINLDNKVKVIVFDIDIRKSEYNDAPYGTVELPTLYSPEDGYGGYQRFQTKEDLEEPRNIWRARGLQPGDVRIMQRGYLSQQMRGMANKIMRAVSDNLKVPTTMAYTGSKGVHVYAFTGLIDCELAVVGKNIVFDSLGFVRVKGKNFFMHPDAGNREDSYAELDVEGYPKQEDLNESRQFGNLVRLPLGVNRKNPSHPCFFMDARGNHGSRAIMRRDALDALTSDDPWTGPAPE